METTLVSADGIRVAHSCPALQREAVFMVVGRLVQTKQQRSFRPSR